MNEENFILIKPIEEAYSSLTNIWILTILDGYDEETK